MSISWRPHVLHSPWNSPGQNTGGGSLFLLQGISPTQGSNLGLPHCRWILYQLSFQGSPKCSEHLHYFMVGQTHLTQRLFCNKVLNVSCNLLKTESENRVAAWVQTVCKCIHCLPPVIAWLSGSCGLAAIAQHHTKGLYHTPPRPGRDQNSKFEEQFLLNAYCTIVKNLKDWSRTIIIWRPSLFGFLSHAGYTHPFPSTLQSLIPLWHQVQTLREMPFLNVIVFMYLFLVALGLHCWAWTFL